jgi:hypothetical protein
MTRKMIEILKLGADRFIVCSSNALIIFAKTLFADGCNHRLGSLASRIVLGKDR